MSQLLHFLDVNIPMYAAGKDHPFKAACVYVLQEIAESRLTVAIDTETIQEILYRYGAIQHWDTATTLAENLLELVPTVYPVATTDIRKAIELFKKYAPQGVTARDVLHAAVMQNNGLTYIISLDEHFDRLEDLTRIAPQALYNQQAQRC